MKQSIDEQADFIYKGRQYFGLEYYDLYNCLHCHTTISDEHLEQHYKKYHLPFIKIII